MFSFIDAGGWFAHLFTPLTLSALNSLRGHCPWQQQPKGSFKARHLLDPVAPDLSQKNEDHQNDHSHPE
jgi:hypothetical protein